MRTLVGTKSQPKGCRVWLLFFNQTKQQKRRDWAALKNHRITESLKIHPRKNTEKERTQDQVQYCYKSKWVLTHCEE